MSIICPNCHHNEFEGALFCSECGSKLVTEDGLNTVTISQKESEITKKPEKKNVTSEVFDTTEAKVSLHIMQTGQILPLVGREVFTIGRVSDGQSILPDIDLSPYEAYAKGVSRLHATIKFNEQEISITDLGSSNGTRINKSKLPPHEENNLNHGDIIALGQFKIQALFRQSE
ncbi:MAG: FHA domain-containing protein [Chloroflexota bacterium]